MVDTPGDSTTTRTISVGETVSDTLEFVNDHDWFRITLNAGEPITIYLNGISLIDPYLYLRDANGNLLSENDDISSGIIRDSRITFTPSQSGTYYIDVAAWQPEPGDEGYPGFTGTYQLSVSPYTPPPVATVDQLANQLVNGYWDGDSHHFNASQGGSITVNLTALPASAQNLARAALWTWTDIIGINFIEVSGVGQGQIIFDDDEEGAFSTAEWANGIITSAEVNVDAQWVSFYGTGLNSYSFQTYIHEIGHALGLGHAGNYNGDAAYPDDALFLNDGWPLSVMSYFSQQDNNFYSGQGFTETYLVTPMLSDIVAMSMLYGLSTTTRTGNTTYGFNSNAGREQFNANLHPEAAYAIYDSGGTDTLNYAGFTQDQRINLNAETFSNVGGLIGNVTIARGVVIENATGGSGNDTLIGNAASNVLLGGAGDDTVSYATATAAVQIDLRTTAQQNTVGAGLDTLSGFERLIGSAFGDTLTSTSTTLEIQGGEGNDRIISTGSGGRALYGENGDDWFVSGVGDDWINGGDGFDLVDYSAATGPINAATEVANHNTGGAGTDSLISVEGILGSNFSDTLWAFQAGGTLWAGAGDDTLRGSGFGASQLYGGAGHDTYQVWHEANEVGELSGEGTDLVIAAANFTLGANVENLTIYQPPVVTDPYAGAGITPQVPGNFSATGNGLANIIVGNAGANILSGLAGADALTGGAGNDTFKDTAAGLSGDTITDFSTADRIVISNASLSGFNFSLSGNVLTYTGGSLTLAGYNGPLYASAAQGGGVQLTAAPAAPVDAHSDFNGDGISDVLWRSESGIVTDWLGLGNGDFHGNYASAYIPLDNSWQIEGTGDFNGDGKDDILWRNADGGVTNWLGQANGGFTGNAGVSYHMMANDWQVAGTGDFNGDGIDDVLWRNDDGIVTNWLGLGNGDFHGNYANAYLPLDNSWQIQGIGDFNGDGKDDILWRNADGGVTNWLGQANGGFAGNAGVSYHMMANDWQVAGTGDFNGDGIDDVLWRNDDGIVTNWLGLGNGDFHGNYANAYLPLDNSWQIQGIGDFNGDGKDDILWRNADGGVTNWLGQANGGFAGNAGVSYHMMANDWQVAGTGDFNGDGIDDVLWRNDDGIVTNWLGLGNGDFHGNYANAYLPLDNSWQIQGIGDFNGDGKDDILWRNADGGVTNWLGQANGGFAGNHGVSYHVMDNIWHVENGNNLV